MPVAVVNCKSSCGNRSPHDLVKYRFPLIADPSHHPLHARWPRIVALGALHSVRSLPYVNHAIENLFERLEIPMSPAYWCGVGPSGIITISVFLLMHFALKASLFALASSPTRAHTAAGVQNRQKRQVEPLHENPAVHPCSPLMCDVYRAALLDG